MKPSKLLKSASLILAAILLSSPVSAAEPEGKALARTLFQSADGNTDNYVTLPELLAFQQDVFVSVDSNDDKGISYKEFSSWGFGMEMIADDAGKKQAYETALKFVFDIWDRDNDQKITDSEMQQGTVYSFSYSDLNNDSQLDAEEYLQGFIFNIAYRSALKPQ